MLTPTTDSDEQGNQRGHSLSESAGALSDGVVISDSRGRIAFVSQWALDETGFESSELVGSPVQRFIPRTSPGWQIGARSGRTKKVTGLRYRSQMFRKDGSCLNVELETSPFTVGGAPLAVTTVRDSGQRAAFEKRLAQVHRQQEVVARLNTSLNEGKSLSRVYKELAEMLKPLIPFDRFTVNRRTGYRRQVRTVFVYGDRVHDMGIGRLGYPPRKKDGPEFRSYGDAIVSDTGEPATDDSSPIQEKFRRHGFKSYMETPLGSPNNPIGYMSIRSRESGVYTRDAAKFFSDIGKQLGPAIRSAELARSLKSMAERERAIARIGRTVSSTLDFDKVWEEFVHQLRRIIPADRIVVTRYVPESKAVVDTHVWGVEVEGWESGRAHDNALTISARVVETAQAAFGDLRQVERKSEKHIQAGLKSGMYAPLVHEGEVIGTLNVKSRKAHAYTAESLPILQTLADQIAGAIASARMHTEAMEAAALRESQIKLEARNERLANESEFKSTLISTVSHELRTPLTGIVAMSDVLFRNKPGNLTPRQLEQLQVVRKSAKMLFLLTNDLLTSSSVEAGKLHIRTRKVNLNDLLEGLARSLVAIYGEKRQRLDMKCGPGIEIMADSMRLEQMVANLLSNASKYSPEDAVIKLEATREGDIVRISVTDQGEGISEENKRKLFDTFFRVDDEATKKSAGTGLGLFIVKTLAESHNGQVHVTSELGKGSTFTIELPVGDIEFQELDAA